MIRFEKLFLAFAIAAAAMFFANSCGYHVGTFSHPQIKSIAVAPVKNDTLEPLVSGIMRQQLCEQVQFDGSLKLKSLQEADCILYCKISEVKTDSITWHSSDNQVTYRPYMFTISVKGEFSVIMPGRGDPVIPTRQISGSATYVITADPEQGRSNGVKQACYMAARQILEYTTEAW